MNDDQFLKTEQYDRLSDVNDVSNGFLIDGYLDWNVFLKMKNRVNRQLYVESIEEQLEVDEENDVVLDHVLIFVMVVVVVEEQQQHEQEMFFDNYLSKKDEYAFDFDLQAIDVVEVIDVVVDELAMLVDGHHDDVFQHVDDYDFDYVMNDDDIDRYDVKTTKYENYYS